MKANANAPEVTIQYSTDNKTWSDFTVGSTTVTLANVDDKVYFRAGPEGNVCIAENTYIENYFTMTGKIAASGNIMSLLNQDFKDLKEIEENYCFSGLFNSCSSLTDASKLVLPATTLTFRCYCMMFACCTSLTTAPKILPAIILDYSCYLNMFYGCSSLTTAPELPATTLADACYLNMFSSCTNLNNVKVAFTEWPSTIATVGWLSNVASTGTFTCPAALPDERGTNRIPTNWTKVDLV